MEYKDYFEKPVKLQNPKYQHLQKEQKRMYKWHKQIDEYDPLESELIASLSKL